MNITIGKRITGLTLAILLLLLLFPAQMWATEYSVLENTSPIEIASINVTAADTTIKVNYTGDFTSGVFMVYEYPAEMDFDWDKTNESGVAQIGFSMITELTPGENTITLIQSPTAGKKVMALLSVNPGTGFVRYYSNWLLVETSAPAQEPEITITTETLRAGDKSLTLSMQYEAVDGYKQYSVFSFPAGQDFELGENTILIASGTPSNTAPIAVTLNTAVQNDTQIMAVLFLSGTQYRSNILTVEDVQYQEPFVYLIDTKITAGDTKMPMTVFYDSNVTNARYTLYQYEGDELDVAAPSTKILNENNNASKFVNQPVNLSYLVRPLTPGHHIKAVLTVTTTDGATLTYDSNVVTVSPSPDWDTPTVALAQSKVDTDTSQVGVKVTFDEAYYDFSSYYCTVTIYMYPSSLDEFDHDDLSVVRLGSLSVTKETDTSQILTVGIDKTKLQPWHKMVAQMRLPHPEWDGEEADYVSMPIDIVNSGVTLEKPLVLLYNLPESTFRGAKMREILADMGVEVKTITDDMLSELVGYVAEIDGFEPSGESYEGEGIQTDYMLMSGLGEAGLDQLLLEMNKAGIRIDHKSIVTEYNRYWTLEYLIMEIAGEHEAFQAILALDKTIKQAEQLKEEDYADSGQWALFTQDLDRANEVLQSYEPELEDILEAESTLKQRILELTGKTELQGTVVLTCVKNGSTYDITASVADLTEDATLNYLWSNKATSKTVTGVSKEDLPALTVIVSGSGTYFGELPKVWLNRPDALTGLTVQQSDGKLTASWDTPLPKLNTPAIESYTVEVRYETTGGQETALSPFTVESHRNSIEIPGLTNGTLYTISICAENAIGSGDKASVTGTPGVHPENPENIWLADYHNPMVGTWFSGPDEDGVVLVFTGESDGTFEYAMLNLPEGANYPASGTGAYLVGSDKTMIAYFDFGLVKGIELHVVDNDTIETKEVQFEDGQRVLGDTANFYRQATASFAEEVPTLLANTIFTGQTWNALIPEPDPDMGIDGYPSTWKFNRDGTVVCTFIGLGSVLGFETPDAAYTFSYTVFGNRLVIYTTSADGNEIRIYKFEQEGRNIALTRLLLEYGGIFDMGNPSPEEPSFSLIGTKSSSGGGGSGSTSSTGQTEKTEATQPTEATEPKEPSSSSDARKNPFTDVQTGHWFYDHVEYAFENGLFAGTSENTFNPNQSMTRAMLVTILWRMHGSPGTGGTGFADVQSGSYYAQAVAWAAENGIVMGLGDGIFAPDAEITREQMAVILHRYGIFSGKQLSIIMENIEFADWDQVSSYAKESVQALASQGILNGKPGNLFDTKGTATRAEVAAMLHRYLEAANQ